MNLPRLVVPNGTIEASKWLALLFMTGDHVNKYLFNGTMPLLFDAGRLVLPLFAFVQGYNLARPGTLERGVYRRAITRLALFALLATPAFLALGSLVAGWWPLNVMFTLLVATVTLYLIELGGNRHLVAAAVMILVGGSLVDFWWPALTLCLAVWWYCKRTALPALLLVTSCAALRFMNGNVWALVALPLIAAAMHVDMNVPRLRWAFYAYYPLHLAALWLIRIPMSDAGYLFF